MADPEKWQSRLMRPSFAQRAAQILKIGRGRERAASSSSGEVQSEKFAAGANDPQALAYGVDCDVRTENIDRRRDVRSLPPWVHISDHEIDIDVAVAEPPRIQPAHHNHLPEDPRRRFNPQAGRGKGWHHARSREAVTMNFPIGDYFSRWQPFVQASAYPKRRSDEGEIVDDDWIRENLADLDEPYERATRSGDLDRDERLWLLSDKKRSATWLHIQRVLMRNPFIPLLLRLTVIIFALVALGLGVQIYERSAILNTSPETTGIAPPAAGVDSQYICKQQPSTYMAFVVDSVAVVYLLYITYDEYFSKPLGLRSSKAKMRLLFLDLFFIIFSAANLSLAFDTLTDQQWSCYEGNPDDSNLNNAEAARSVCVQNMDLCRRQRALVSVLLIAEIAWVSTFAISVLRVVERIQR